ncbi:hypothetical protein FPOAC2_06529 [Fusarium poae]
MDNGNVVINTDGNVIWSTNTTQPGETTASAPVSATPGAPAPEPVKAPSSPDRVMAGGALGLGQSIVSASGEYTLVMQNDTNCCLYKKDQGCIWAKGMSPGNSAQSISFRTDGELEILTYFGDPKWRAGTAGRGNANSYWQIRDDGNMVIVTDGKIVWSSRTGPALPELKKTSVKGGQRLLPGEMLTSANGQYTLTLTDDINLELAQDSTVLWSSASRTDYGWGFNKGGAGGWAQVNSNGTLEIFVEDDFENGSRYISQKDCQRGPGDVVLLVQDSGVASMTYNGLPVGIINLLKPRDIIKAGQVIQSSNGEHQLSLLPNGNLQVYHVSAKVTGVFTTIPNSTITDATYLTMGDDLVVEIQGADKRSLWRSPNRQPDRRDRDLYRDRSDGDDFGRSSRNREPPRPIGLMIYNDSNIFIQTPYNFEPWRVSSAATLASVGDALRPGTQLKAYQCLRSVNGEYTAYLDSQGDFKLMQTESNYSSLLWRSKTGGADSVWMNSHGGLCVGSNGQASYQSNPGQLGEGDLVLVVQNDGNMCIYLGGNCRFSSNTAHGFPNIDSLY